MIFLVMFCLFWLLSSTFLTSILAMTPATSGPTAGDYVTTVVVAGISSILLTLIIFGVWTVISPIFSLF